MKFFLLLTTITTISAIKPNFLIFQPDDMAFYWNDAPESSKSVPEIPVPNLDKLRAEGAAFTRTYTASPMCAPSRYSVLTGRYPSRSKFGQGRTEECSSSNTITSVTVPNSKLDLEKTSTLATSLKDLGYMTGTVGKWHVSVELGKTTQNWLPTDTVYPKATQLAKDTGFDYADGFYIGNMDNACTKNKCADTIGFSHNMEWVTSKGMEFIQSAKDASKPFFLYFNPTVPHSPDVEEALNTLTIRDTPAGTLASDPITGMPTRANVLARANAAPGKVPEGISATWIDDSMGALYTKLKDLQMLDDTLIVFVQDHGASGKSTLYETGARIAMFARYPNYLQNGGTGATNPFAAGTIHSTLLSNIDLAPTFIHLASGTAPSKSDVNKMDGTSILSEISTQASGTARTIFSELNKDRTAISTKWKYIRRNVENYAGGAIKMCQEPDVSYQASSYPNKLDMVQLYDLATDGMEQNNVANGNADVKATMEGALECHLKMSKIGSVDYSTNCEGAVSDGSYPVESAGNANANNLMSLLMMSVVGSVALHFI